MRSAERDAAARAALVPLREGERPVAVTVAAIVCVALVLVNLLLYALDEGVSGERQSVIALAAYTVLLLAAAWGLWRAVYWVVLAVQAVLVFLILLASYLALRFETALDLVIALAILVAAGTLFWHLVKAMARIQMPERR
jgi:hypothetical protein